MVYISVSQLKDGSPSLSYILWTLHLLELLEIAAVANMGGTRNVACGYNENRKSCYSRGQRNPDRCSDHSRNNLTYQPGSRRHNRVCESGGKPNMKGICKIILCLNQTICILFVEPSQFAHFFQHSWEPGKLFLMNHG